MAFRRDKALAAAQQYAQRGDLNSAVREYQSVLEHDPSDVQTWLLLADSLHRGGNLDGAIDRYVHAANLLLEAGEVPNALQVYRQVLNLAPERYDVHMRTAQAFEQLRRMPEAVALYEKVAGVYLRSGNTREALMLYERVADLMPREVAKRLRLAELFSREKRVDEAVQQFKLGADFLRQAGRNEEFVRVAERLLYHRPVDAVIRDLVRVYLELGQPRRALMKLNELLSRQNHDAEGLELLADTFVRLGNVKKATTVVYELVKIQREAGPEGAHNSARVLRKAIAWAPQDAKLKQTLAELGVDDEPRDLATPDDDDDIDDIDEIDDIEEIDDLEEIEEFDDEPATPPPRRPPSRPPARSQPPQPTRQPPQPARQPEPEAPSPRQHSLTEEVINEGAQASEDIGDIDLDKQLEEVRVLMKYHLYEHALTHAEQILSADPMHVQGLELSAEILAAIGRNSEAADCRARLAVMLVEHDPAAAARHVELALALIPDHPMAVEVGERLSEMSGVDVGIADVDDARPPKDDPLGALDLDDDMLGPIETSDSLIGAVDNILDEGIRHPSEYSSAVPDDGLDDGLDSIDDLELDEPDRITDIDISAADPGLASELNRIADDDEPDFAISVHTESEVEEPEDEIGVEDRFGLGSDDEDEDESMFGDPDAAPDAAPDAHEQVMVGRVEPDDDAASLADDDAPFGAPEPEPEEENWPDLSAELEELEFYLSQDLEDDALAAYNDLVELFPGHPGLAKIAHRFPDAPGAEVDAAAPLLDLEDEDEDEDDFLAAIFDDDAPKQRKQREVAIQTHEVGDADASDHFDLGTAYREMGLFDKAFAEYEAASRDLRWKAKALVMMGSLRAQSGEMDAAIVLFTQAVEAARTKDERCESNYELAMANLNAGNFDEAIEALERVEPGYRDRDEKLAELA